VTGESEDVAIVQARECGSKGKAQQHGDDARHCQRIGAERARGLQAPPRRPKEDGHLHRLESRGGEAVGDGERPVCREAQGERRAL